jgi:hypothetical protein
MAPDFPKLFQVEAQPTPATLNTSARGALPLGRAETARLIQPKQNPPNLMRVMPPKGAPAVACALEGKNHSI